MRRAWIRSTIFNILFYTLTAACSVLFIPGLLLPRKWFTGLVRAWLMVATALEYSILNLHYEVRGLEHLPKDGPYIIAAKHQSPYETLKLRLLFPDPAIILKKELLKIPLWGACLKKSGVIAIDRSTPEKAMESIAEGSVKMMNNKRPILIFPQGTRVNPEETPAQKPYKVGVARIQEATNLPIIPMALNTGLFWPRSGWLKSSGTVVFEFLEPIQPGKSRSDLLKELEEKTEERSNALMNEARAEQLNEKSNPAVKIGIALFIFALLFAGYSYLWFFTAKQVKEVYVAFLTDVAEAQRMHGDAVITGYPGPVKLEVSDDSIVTKEGSIKVDNLLMKGWPIPFTPISVKTGAISIQSYKWRNPLVMDSLDGVITYSSNNVLTIWKSSLRQGNFEAQAKGDIDLKQEPVPRFDVMIKMVNYAEFLTNLAQLEIIEQRQAMFMAAGFSMLSNDGVVEVPITQNGQTLYAGPLPVASLPAAPLPEPGNLPAPGQ